MAKRTTISVGCCWLSPPNLLWSPKWYIFTVRGAESAHIYLWVLKDLAWGCDWYYPGFAFAISACIWSLALLVRSAYWRNFKEIWTGTAQLGWLVGNTLWMTGELHDSEFPNDTPVYDLRMEQGGIVLKASLVWLAVYYLFVKPFGPVLWPWLQPSLESEQEYDDTGLESHYKILGFKTWRELEHLHLFLWLAKDTFWNAMFMPMWILFAIPTVLLALDFCRVTFWVNGMCIENAHMITQLIWVTANLVWGAGEIWHIDDDLASPLLSPIPVPGGGVTMRWVSVLLLFIAFLPIIALHTHWLLCTYNRLVYMDGNDNGNAGGMNGKYSSVGTESTGSATVNPLLEMELHSWCDETKE